MTDWEVISLLVLFMTYTTVDSQSLYFCDSNGTDPCEIVNTKQPFQPNARYVICQYDADRPYCDRYITPGWYRYSATMLDKCPSLLSCGAVYPYWLDGSHPANVNQEVVRTVCKAGFASCCDKQVTIKIRHCGEFMAYCLPALDSCSERYCFGESGECEPTTTVSLQSTTPTLPKEQSTLTSSSYQSQSTYHTTLRTSTQSAASTEKSPLSTESPKSTGFSSTSTSSDGTTSSKTTLNSNHITSPAVMTTSASIADKSTIRNSVAYKSTTSASVAYKSTTGASVADKSTTSASVADKSTTITSVADKSTTITSVANKSTTKTTESPNAMATTSSVLDHCSNGIDPCDARNDIGNVPNLVNRSDQCIYESILKPCDQDLERKWYKGFKLLDRCPKFLTCGAVYPLWVNGSEPEVKDGLVTREVCKVGPNSCCEEKFEIKVVNCSLYTAYCLRPLRRCEERYCFDTKTCSKSPQHTINTNTDNSLPTTTITVIGIAVFLAVLLVIVSGIIYLKRCRNKPDNLYEKPLSSPSENEYEMPVTSNINNGNVYDELPDMKDGATVPTTADDNQYDYIQEQT